METILMCPPEFYNVSYIINPWMSGNIGFVDTDLAKRQWETLYNTISRFANVEIIQPQIGLPDMVFTANAGAIINDVFYLSKFKYGARTGEEKFFKEWAQKKYKVVELIHDFEGAGDLLYSGINDIHFMGYGKRSVEAASLELSSYSGAKIIPLELVTEDFYHLDTCFCPLNDGSIMLHYNAIKSYSWGIINHIFEGNIINVDKTDAALFACNAVNIDNNIILPKGISLKLETQLSNRGFVVHQVDLSEFIKAGGAAKCLTLKI